MTRIALFLLLACVAQALPIIRITMPVDAGGPWLDTDYDKRISVTIKSSVVGSTLTDVPVKIDLDDMPDTFHSSVETDGDDIRASADDHTTELAVDLERIDTTAKTGTLWVLVPSISSSTDTEIFIYYDAGAAEPPYASPEDVWDATGGDYIAAWLMNDAADGPQDSATAVANIQADNFNTDSGDSVAGVAGNSVIVDGSNEYYSVPTADATSYLRPDTSFTASVWFKATDFTDGVIFQGSGSSTNMGYGLWIWGGQLRPSLGNGGNVWSSLTEPTSGLSTGTWYHCAITWDGTNARMYLDGSEVTDSPQSETGAWSWASQPFFIGRRESAGYVAATIDHLTVHDSTFSADRIAFEETNQRDTVPNDALTVGSEETQ